jgi:hypothetical protein
MRCGCDAPFVGALALTTLSASFSSMVELGDGTLKPASWSCLASSLALRPCLSAMSAIRFFAIG